MFWHWFKIAVDEKYGVSCQTHCCKWHGCKYGYGKLNYRSDKLCAVKDGGVEQTYPCEYCSMDWEDYITAKEFSPEWIKYIKNWKENGGYI